MKAKEKTPNPPKQEPTDPDEPIDVLVNLAREGEIDPWDIDIVEVTDKFLERLDEADLARSGRGILYASILLRMKSDYLVEEGEEDEDEEEEFDEPQMGMMPSEGWNDAAGGDFDDGFDQIDALEREYERRIERRSVRDRTKPETLDELVRELWEMERGTW
ncbi:MAG: segregation/condensation protein A, partial [Halobacteria archaeon]|nr:segregation/condensation protein A [Halobacteria archaeon]